LSIGRRIAEIRKSKKITQELLAKQLNKTPQWLSNIERGVRLIGADDLAMLARLLQVDPGIFFTSDFNDTWKQTKSTA